MLEFSHEVAVRQIRSGCAFFALVAWVSLPCMVACSSSNDTQVIARIEHPHIEAFTQ